MSGKRLELFSALFAGMVAYVCATPYFYTKAIKFGVEMAGGEVKEDEKTTFHLPKKKKEPVMSEDEKRTLKYWQILIDTTEHPLDRSKSSGSTTDGYEILA